MLPDWYKNYKTFIENSIIYYTKKYLDTKTSSVLEDFKQIIFYSISEGKRIRSILALEFYINFSSKKIEQIKKDDDIMKFCIALEMIHTCSLVHDDLPCMDNDFYRRGKLTVWKKYGEANAVLVGDFLNNITFEILSEIKNPELGQKLIKLLSKSVGFHGMIGGQVEDIYFEKKIQELNKNILENLHNKKTGALIVSSVLGGIILGTNLKNLKNYEEFAKNIGLAFQIKDDLLDAKGAKKKNSKIIGLEEKGFVYFLGVEKSEEYLEKLTKKSLKIIKNIKSEKLNFLVNYIKNREK